MLVDDTLTIIVQVNGKLRASFKISKELEKDNNRAASQLSSKLQCFQWIKIFRDIESQNKLQDFLTILYFGAKKEYATAGPFLKIY